MLLDGHLLSAIRQIGAVVGGIVKTGQVTQYSGELDDGFYEMGIAMSYNVFTTGQYAGTTNVTVAARTDVKSNNCVRDLVTGLMWSRYVSASVGPLADGRMVWTGAADDIFAYCAAANLAGLAGWSDWRVPNCKELQTIMNYEVATAVPDPVAFPTWPADVVQGSTTTPNNITLAMGGVFTTGQIQILAKNTGYFCALVRGGVS